MITIKEMHDIAAAKNGLCLSEIYINDATKLKWKCNVCHLVWEATPNNIKRNKWCPKCGRLKADKNRRVGIEEIKKMAKDRGGECLAKDYNTIEDKVSWKCKYDHEWTTSIRSVRNGSWCIYCSKFKSETVCRWVFETIFEKQFIKTRPDWLVLNGNKLELDGFCGELNLAFEHNGQQHYNLSFNMNNKDLDDLKKRDIAKIELCKENNVNLIVVNRLFEHTSFTEFVNDVKKLYKNIYGVESKKDCDLKDVPSFFAKEMSVIEMLVNSKGGECLSAYVRSQNKINIKCKRNHIFSITPNKLKNGQWCKKCGFMDRKSKQQHNIEFCKNLAVSRNGVCLSNTYKNNKQKLLWQCQHGHQWESCLASINCRNSWCPKCANKR